MNIKIRRLVKGDFRRGFFESLENLYESGLTIEKAEKIFDELSQNPFYHFFVAEVDGQVVGVATLLVEQKFLLKGARFAHIEDVAVRKENEREGIGRRLIEAAVDLAKEKVCCTVRLTCNCGNVAFYEKCGFRIKEHMMQMDLYKVN